MGKLLDQDFNSAGLLQGVYSWCLVPAPGRLSVTERAQQADPGEQQSAAFSCPKPHAIPQSQAEMTSELRASEVLLFQGGNGSCL